MSIAEIGTDNRPRPVTLAALAGYFGASPKRLAKLLDEHDIEPWIVVGRTPLYGSVEVQAAYEAIYGHRFGEEPGEG